MKSSTAFSLHWWDDFSVHTCSFTNALLAHILSTLFSSTSVLLHTFWHLVMCFNAVNVSGPAYLSELLHVYTPSHTLGSSDNHVLKIHDTNARLMAFTPSHAFDPTFGIHSHKTLDTAQPCHILKANWKPSSSHSIFAPTNISTKIKIIVIHIWIHCGILWGWVGCLPYALCRLFWWDCAPCVYKIYLG